MALLVCFLYTWHMVRCLHAFVFTRLDAYIAFALSHSPKVPVWYIYSMVMDKDGVSTLMSAASHGHAQVLTTCLHVFMVHADLIIWHILTWYIADTVTWL